MKEKLDLISQSIDASVKSDRITIPKDRYKDLMRKEEILREFKGYIDNEFLRI